jgi:hypothetical protein
MSELTKPNFNQYFNDSAHIIYTTNVSVSYANQTLVNYYLTPQQLHQPLTSHTFTASYSTTIIQRYTHMCKMTSANIFVLIFRRGFVLQTACIKTPLAWTAHHV